MFEDQHIIKGTLKEFCEFDLNKRFYDYYHQELKPYFEVEIDLVDFFKELDSDVSVFYFNYLDLPYDVNQYLKKKFDQKSNTEENAISTELRYILFNYISTVMTNQHKIGDSGEVDSLELKYNPPVYDSFWTFQRGDSVVFLKVLKSKELEADDFLQDFYGRVIDETDEVRLKKYVLGLASNQNKNFNPEPWELDLINSTGAEKIVMLHELGVIDFLSTKQPFSTSVNSLAKVLSVITGEKQTNLQSKLSPMFDANNN